MYLLYCHASYIEINNGNCMCFSESIDGSASAPSLSDQKDCHKIGEWGGVLRDGGTVGLPWTHVILTEGMGSWSGSM